MFDLKYEFPKPHTQAVYPALPVSEAAAPGLGHWKCGANETCPVSVRVHCRAAGRGWPSAGAWREGLKAWTEQRAWMAVGSVQQADPGLMADGCPDSDQL